MRQRAAVTEIVTLAAFCAFLLFFGLGAFGLVGADEPRYAQIAREMLARHDWVTPVLNGKPWLEKPVLYYWEAMLSYSIFGVHDWSARLPGAFSAATMVIAVYWFWQRMNVRLVESAVSALDAALIVLSTAGVIGFGRGASTDMPLAANFSIAMLCWAAWYVGRHRLPLLLFYVFLAFGALAKGPIAPGLAGLIIVIFCLLRRESETIWKSLWIPGIAAFLLLSVPWYVLVQHSTGNFFRFFFLEQNLQRFGTNNYRHPQPFWYYVPVTLAATIPWLVWSLRGIVDPLKRLRSRLAEAGTLSSLEEFFALWALVPVVFFSFSQSKLPGYILPAIPAWAMLAAVWISQATRKGTAPRAAVVAVHCAFAAALLAAVVVSPAKILRAPVTQPAMIAALICGIAIFAAMMISILRRGWPVLRFVTLVPVVLAIAFILRVASPALDAKLSARPVAQELAKMESKPSRIAVLHVKRELEYGLNFYRDQPIENYDRAEIPAVDHLVVARAGSESELTELVGGRRVVRLGEDAAQQLEFFWVTSQVTHTMDHATIDMR